MKLLTALKRSKSFSFEYKNVDFDQLNFKHRMFDQNLKEFEYYGYLLIQF